MAGAVTGLSAGIVTATTVMLLWNWVLTPLYEGIPRAAVEGMLLPIILPFNLLKAGLNTGLTLLLYKPLVNSLRKLRLIEHRESSGSFHWTGIFIALGILVVCISAAVLILHS